MDAAGEKSDTAKTERKKTKKKKPSPKKSEVEDPQDNIIATDSIKKSTKATFDLYLEQAQANIARDRKSSPKKGKSRRKKEGEEVLLENLRNSREFQKDKDEETKRRNTFDPDESKEKSNKRRDKQRKPRVSRRGSTQNLLSRTDGAENGAFELEEKGGATPDEPADAPMTIEELSKQKKSKKKKKSKLKDEEEETSFIEKEPAEEQPKTEKKGKSAKKSKEPVSEAEEKKSMQYLHYTDEAKIVGVVVHRADNLRTNLLVQHPLVRVHLVDGDTGQHLQKQDKNRPVTSFYETMNRDEVLETILPMMTQAFDFKEMRTVVPWWDEMLLFNETFNNLVQERPNVIMFFEVLDFVSMTRASKNKYNQSIVKGEEGWHKEAWAFLKLRGANGKLNVDKQVRLQLFEVPTSRMVTDEVPVYQYWKYCVRRVYPSSLYVSIKSILPPNEVEPGIRSMFPNQEEQGTMATKQRLDTLTRSHIKDRESTEETPSNWSKLPGQMCKLPNSMMLSLPAGRMGCLVMAFSHDGRYLACGCQDKSTHPILVYEIPSGQLALTLTGHYNNIYEINWSRADKYLLSASSDGTARVWDVDTHKCLKMLPHPTFVYCAKFHPRVSKVVVTGSYDNIVRVWHVDGTELQAELQQELDEHESYVNSVCFDEEGSKLFTADSGGIIKIWNVYVTEKSTQKGITRDWKLNSSVENEELKEQQISYLHLHPNGRRLLVQTKDNTIRMLDLRMMTVTQRYIGALNFREIVHSDITVCGTFVLSGSEDGYAYVWNTETGDQVAVYSDLKYAQTVNDVKFHPKDHIVAFCSRGDNHKVQVFKYDFNWVGNESQSKYTLVSKSQLAIDRASVELQLYKSRKPIGDRVNEYLDEQMMNYLNKPVAKVSNLDTEVRNALRLTKYHHSLPSDDEVVPEQEKPVTLDTKKQRAMKKLETVMVLARGLESQRRHLEDENLMTSSPPDTYNMTGTWGSTFDTFSQTAATRRGTTIMSPHARQTGETEAMRNHLTSQMQYMKKGTTQGWRPGFSPIGTRSERPPAMNMSMPSQNKPGSFTLQGADDMKPIGQVVALYDYLAQRSDELSFRKGDIISVLYKDTEQWWMAVVKETGAQGFIPSNYVQNTDAAIDDAEHVFTSTRKSTTAVMDKGQLKFISGTESDASSGDNLEGRRRTRRKRRGSRDQKLNQVGNGVPSFDHLL